MDHRDAEFYQQMLKMNHPRMKKATLTALISHGFLMLACRGDSRDDSGDSGDSGDSDDSDDGDVCVGRLSP